MDNTGSDYINCDSWIFLFASHHNWRDLGYIFLTRLFLPRCDDEVIFQKKEEENTTRSYT